MGASKNAAGGRGRKRPRSGGKERAAAGGKGAADWNCASCGNFNYKFRDHCNKCKLPKGAAPGSAPPIVATSDEEALPESKKPCTSGDINADAGEPRKDSKKGDDGKKGGAKKAKVPKGKGQRQRVKQLTQKIVQFAKRKRLGDAQRVFRQLTDEGLTPSLLTYSTFINAHVASGDMIGAERVFQDMQAAGIAANTVIYNTLFKGFRVAGNIARTAALFSEMTKEGVTPDTSTVNAHLSGCLRAGDVEDAHAVFVKMSKDWAAEPDFFTYKREAQMLSRGLRLDALEDVHRRLQGLLKQPSHDGGASAPVGGTEAALVWLHLHRGLAAALLGRWDVAAEALCKVEEAGAAAAVAPEVHLARSSQQQKQQQEEVPEDRAQHEFHFKVFEGEMARLREFLERQAVLLDGCKGAEAKKENKRRQQRQLEEEAAAPDLRGPFSRTFIFGAHTNAQARKQLLGDEEEGKADDEAEVKKEDKKKGRNEAEEGEGDVELARGLARSLERSFGLDVCVGLGAFSLGSMEKRFRRRLRGARLHLPKVFKRKDGGEGGGAEEEEDLPVKLEICSGFGEWVVAQAKAEAGAANWAALELRYDRCHGIFSRMVFEGVTNLCVLGGDAAQILPGHIAPCSVDHIFINFPEPPQTNMLQGAESHLHLLTAEFFKDMHRVLRKGGRITILHDEHRYCCLIARTVAALNREATANKSSQGSEGGGMLLEPVLGLRGKGKSKDECEDIDGIRLYHGVPGKKSGHVVRSSSYFDQLWETKDRYFLVLSKC